VTTLAGTPRPVHMPRAVLVASVSLLLAFLVQTAVLPAIGLSAAVPVVWSMVCLFSLVLGSRVGAVLGFLAGLLLDLTSSGVLGVGALTGCLVGSAAGAVRTDRWIWSGAGWIWLLVSLAAAGMQVANDLALGITPVLTVAAFWLIGGALVCTLALLPTRAWLQAVLR